MNWDPNGTGPIGTAIGVGIGGFLGGLGGGVVGGVLGAGAGTIVAPGFGTVGGGITGAQAVAAVGAVAGAGIGGYIGDQVGDAIDNILQMANPPGSTRGPWPWLPPKSNAGKSCPSSPPPNCSEERQACADICADAQSNPDLPHVYGGGIAQCIRSCLPAACGGEPVSKGSN